MIRKFLDNIWLQWLIVLGLPLTYDYTESNGALEVGMTYFGGILATGGVIGIVGFILMYIEEAILGQSGIKKLKQGLMLLFCMFLAFAGYRMLSVVVKGWDEMSWHSVIFPVIIFLGGIGGTYAMFLEIRQAKPEKNE